MEVSQVRRNRRQGNKTNGTIRWRLIITVFALTLALGLMGTAAAQWSDSIFINEKAISTGQLCVVLAKPNAGSDNNVTIDLEEPFWCEYHRDYESHEAKMTVNKIPNGKFINFQLTIRNHSTIPVKLGEPIVTWENTNAFTIEWTEYPDEIIDGNTDTNNIHGKLKVIDPDNPPETGTYNFSIVIPVRAWNDSGGLGWSENLYISGQVMYEKKGKGNGGSPVIDSVPNSGEQLPVDHLAVEQLAGEQL